MKSDQSIRHETNKSLGIALGGGAVLGAVHIGVLRALEEHAIYPEIVTGTSIGSLIGSLYAFGQSSAQIESLMKKLGWMDVSEISLSKFSLLTNERLGKLLDDALGKVNIESAPRKLALVSTDLVSGEKVLITEGRLSTAVMASACIPGLYRPIELNKRLLIDGGLAENVPAVSARQLGARSVIAVDLSHHCNPVPKNIIDVMMNSFSIMMMRLSEHEHSNNQLTITPDLSKSNMVNVKQIPELIEKGYQETCKRLQSEAFQRLSEKD